MVILIDTNVILDHFIPRQPFLDIANDVLNLCYSYKQNRLQVECARLINADYIVTRNIEDFAASSIPAILPEDFLKKVMSD